MRNKNRSIIFVAVGVAATVAYFSIGHGSNHEYVSAARINGDTADMIFSRNGRALLQCAGGKRDGDIEAVSFNGQERDFQPFSSSANFSSGLRTQQAWSGFLFSVREQLRQDPLSDPFADMMLEDRPIDEFWAFPFPHSNGVRGAIAKAETDEGVRYTVLGVYGLLRQFDKQCGDNEKIDWRDRKDVPQAMVLIVRVDPAAKNPSDRAAIYSLVHDGVDSGWVQNSTLSAPLTDFSICIRL